MLAADWRVLVLVLILIHNNSTLRWQHGQKEAANSQPVSNGTVPCFTCAHLYFRAANHSQFKLL